MIRLPDLCRRLGKDESGLALLEFAFSLPIFLTMALTGAELTNYITTRMRVSQVALQLADNAARIGSGAPIASKTITEADINDLLTGAGLQASELDLYRKGRVIISSLEPDTAAGHTGKFMIRWQRCRGSAAHPSGYGVAGANNLTGIGPGNKAVPPPNGVAMFAEVFYTYQPLIKTSLSPSTTMTETASMMVRDRRDTSDDTKLANGSNNPNPQHPNGIYKVAGVTASTC
ncbi:hypothetical protein FHS95_000193 [Sphingomonas naasensis]|uniref:Pilus assembly protein n=1 Tax=Sphingomonas naasensis TaxID=1344951 RepID=A0A4S1WTY9_9SPHN|nr:TadE/TadG family type IV pilus assembly protein [Sphingomonas naasensis]NIJ18524.1 hypothetical protein [Sphingomonas naasensis]TGX45777.1 pilus assembly protein [Sphingomonas naasensis]